LLIVLVTGKGLHGLQNCRRQPTDCTRTARYRLGLRKGRYTLVFAVVIRD